MGKVNTGVNVELLTKQRFGQNTESSQLSKQRKASTNIKHSIKVPIFIIICNSHEHKVSLASFKIMNFI